MSATNDQVFLSSLYKEFLEINKEKKTSKKTSVRKGHSREELTPSEEKT